MIAALVLLAFAICPAGGRACEEGIVIHRDCELAEAWVRAGLRSDQCLVVRHCRPHDGRWPGGD